MDDFVLSNLYQAKDEWSARLVSVLAPFIAEGVHSIFDESVRLCAETNEMPKYLVNFQKLLTRIPLWSNVIVEEEVKRIIQRSGCNYIEDLITCVHIIQLKVLTSIRVGTCQKKIDINIPKLDVFVHKVYIHVARKMFLHVYLFEKTNNMLQAQKHNRDIEVLVQECILNTIRDSIPTETIIRAYLDDSVEHDEEVTIEDVDSEPETEGRGGAGGAPAAPGKATFAPVDAVATVPEQETPAETPFDFESLLSPPPTSSSRASVSFNDMDNTLDHDGNIVDVSAPKTIDRLESISVARAAQKKAEDEAEAAEDRLQIFDDPVDVGNLDVFNLDIETL
jgi:hypothetical protein